MEIKNKRILVTGSNSHPGRSLIPKLKQKGAEVFSFSSKRYNLTKEEDVENLFEYSNPQAVIHLAVDNGGFAYTRDNPEKIFYNNIMMNTLVQKKALERKVEKFVGIGSATSYPESLELPFKEEDFWKGYPVKSHASLGLSKRMMLAQSQFSRAQKDFNSIHLVLVNLYGPHYDVSPDRLRVVPIFIEKFLEAKKKEEKSIQLKGSPNALREFLYIGDCTDAIIMATELYDKPEPVNIGSGKEISMGSLAKKIKEATDFKGDIMWEKTHSDHYRCNLDISKAENEFGFKARINLEDGLKKTVDWHSKNFKK